MRIGLKRLLFGKRLVVLVGVLLTMAAAPVGILTLHQYMDAEATSGGEEEVADLPDVAPPAIGDAPSDAELEDIQAMASRAGMSLQDAIDRYAWNDNFALAVSKIREAVPGDFTGAEVVDAGNAWVAFAGDAPQAALDIIDIFTSSHSGVAAEVRTGEGFTETELQKAIEAAHFAVHKASEVSDAITTFDFATGQIKSTVVMSSTISDTVIEDLRTLARTKVTDATRADILDSITADVARSEHDVLGGEETNNEHLGGEALSTCTAGFGTITSSQARGIATAGHCRSNQSDDGHPLSFHGQHVGTHGDFQWHSGTETHTDDFYAGNNASYEADRRDVAYVGGTPGVGNMLCRNGKTSNRDCQEVRKVNVCKGDVCNLAQMGEHLSDDGDSGGPVYLNHTAYGIHKGCMYDPFPAKREIFSRADRIDEALGIYIATE